MLEVNISKSLKSELSEFEMSINCRVENGEIIGLFGNSGAGKTSLLRILAGFMSPESGTITINDQPWFDHDKGVNIRTSHRNIGYVFQESALFPNMTVLDNLKYALQKGQSIDEINEITELAELNDLLDRKPGQLSGGQQQRVALGRALVRKPDLLLLDEPLSALDYQMRSRMQDIILQSQQILKFTVILVTHEMSEIFKVCNRVFIMEDGQIIDRGKPGEVFSKHKSGGKFSFTGEVLDISKEDVVYIVTVLIGSEITKVIADETEANKLSVGDRVMVSSKAFNPIIQKI